MAQTILSQAITLTQMGSCPYRIPTNLLAGLVFSVNWDDGALASHGGINATGQAVIELALGAELSAPTSSSGYMYVEHDLERSFPCLQNVSPEAIIACLVAHELAHVCIFGLSRTDSSIVAKDDHCDDWKCLYRYLRSNLLFIYAFELYESDISWSADLWRTIHSTLPSLVQRSVERYIDTTDPQLALPHIARYLADLSVSNRLHEALGLSTRVTTFMHPRFSP
ncbi:hypothetical protein QTV44_002514 [Vibrio vulnificus]|nr:hypothetical protein [Vibrio vulnificus]